MRRPWRGAWWLMALLGAGVAAADVGVVLEAGGEGYTLRAPRGLATDARGNLYVTGMFSHNVLRVAPDGKVTEIASAAGAGEGAPLTKPRSLAIDSQGNVFVAGEGSHNVLRISRSGKISQVLDTHGDGSHPMRRPSHLGIDAQDRLYVASQGSDNVLRLSPDGAIRQVIGPEGDGEGHILDRPNGLAVARDGTFYVAGARSRNAFRVGTDGVARQVLDRTGPGRERGLIFPNWVAIDPEGRGYVVGNNSGNLLRIALDGTIDELSSPKMDGALISPPCCAAVLPDGSVALVRTHSVWLIRKDGSRVRLLDVDGAGGQRLKVARGVTADAKGNLYVAGFGSDNVFRLSPPFPQAVPGQQGDGPEPPAPEIKDGAKTPQISAPVDRSR